MVVLAINRAELRHSVESVYGNDFDADWYLRRFADLHISLPPPDEQNLSAFLDGLLVATGLSAKFTTSSNSYSASMLKMLAESPGRSLRDLEQAVHLAVVALASFVSSDQARTNQSGVWEHAVVALIVFRALDEAAYQRLAYDDADGFAAVAALDGALGPSSDPEEGIGNSDGTREQIEAFLIAGSSDNRFHRKDYQAEFVKRYTFANQWEEERAHRVLEVCMQNHQAAGREPRVKLIAEFIDLVSYAPVEAIEEAD